MRGYVNPESNAMIELTLNDMTCGHCVKAITLAAKSVDAAAAVEADLASKQVRIYTTASRERVLWALAEAGYTPA